MVRPRFEVNTVACLPAAFAAFTLVVASACGRLLIGVRAAICGGASSFGWLLLASSVVPIEAAAPMEAAAIKAVEVVIPDISFPCHCHMVYTSGLAGHQKCPFVRKFIFCVLDCNRFCRKVHC